MEKLMWRIVFSAHGSKRARERGVPEEWAGEVIDNAEETAAVKFGRKASYKDMGESPVVVIYEEGIDKILVVTILKVETERLKRYGFGGI
jgi:hypothetical protein